MKNEQSNRWGSIARQVVAGYSPARGNVTCDKRIAVLQGGHPPLGDGISSCLFATQLQKLKLMVAKSLRSPLKICGATHIFLTLLQIPLNKLSANKLKKEQPHGCSFFNWLHVRKLNWTIFLQMVSWRNFKFVNHKHKRRELSRLF